MKNKWMDYFFGRVTVKVAGKGIERFLNVLIRNGLSISDVKRHGTETITFKIKLDDAFKIRHFARKSGVRLAFLQRRGMPFLVKRMVKNGGFFLGSGLFLLIIFLLSNVIWGIEIKGAKPATEYQIRKELDKMGVKIGNIQFFVNDVETIQKTLTDHIGALTWVGVELKGTTYHFQVVEKNQPKEPEQLAPRNLIAKKKATIVSRYVEKGQPVVEKNDQVQKGQLLVSGLIGKEGEEKPVAAKGEIWGETWYQTHVELPLTTKFNVFTGKEKRKHSLLLGSLKLPFWGFGKPAFSEYETETNTQKIHFLKWELPISIVNETVRQRQEIVRSYTNGEAVKIALDMAKKDIKSKLDEDAIIKETKILHKVIVNGKVNLDVFFKVYENIAQPQPIIQGDKNDTTSKNN
ncbi:sporulation protein YqfD [Neobacillus sp. SM06]|uniref:sporulation protein YqfD n=1 Tax=Neobacillus sp. SM06 TaxID=3422492 RepID=UPI003D2C2CC8